MNEWTEDKLLIIMAEVNKDRLDCRYGIITRSCFILWAGLKP